MAILETEVLVGVTGKIKYYEELGYNIPRYVDKQGRYKVKRGTKIYVNVTDLPNSSEVPLTKICDSCNKKLENYQYKTILKNRNNGIDLCHKCAHLKYGEIKRNNVIYSRSLEFFALENDKKYLLLEFSSKNTKTPKEISYGTRDMYLWNCPKCKSEYDMSPNKRTCRGTSCPYCAGKKVNHTNCMWSTHPEIAKLLKNNQRGYEVLAMSNTKAEFKCERCNYSETKIISQVINNGFACPKCSDGISYPEKLLFNLLNQLNLDFEYQKSNFKWIKNKKYDFYIPSINCIIETHGGQHYKPMTFERTGGKTLKEEQENDRLKENAARKNGIKYYVIIDCRKSNLNYIKENILDSELAFLFNLTNINWNQCHEHACGSIIKEACDLWREGLKTLTEIGNALKVNRTSVGKYLRQGAELGWCNYAPEKFKGDKNGKSIVQLSMNDEFIKEWDSMAKAYKTINIAVTNISAVCREKRKSTSNYKWMFKEDYEIKMLKQGGN